MTRPIRSLLWIGTGRGLAESGVTEAPQLDVTWVPDLREACALPRIAFDGILFETESLKDLPKAIADLSTSQPRIPVLLSLPAEQEPSASAFLDCGVAAAFFVPRDRSGPGLVMQVSEALESIQDRAYEASPATTVEIRLPARTASLVQDARVDSALRPAPHVAPDEAAAARLTPANEGAAWVARSEAMRDVFEFVRQAAGSPSTVLVTGETGVGKEVIARALHAQSPRREEPFVAINCAAFPETLLESELFGHTKGSFTGAERAKQGLFEAAARGTLFLDEIAETGLPLQAKLLRVLQEREIRPVGGTKTVAVTCRIVAATNRTLSDEVRDGHFREDLFYRLNVFPIRIPPLRDRREEVLPLARHFLTLHGPREGKLGCHLSLASSQLLQSYAWPGNVRELENEVLRMLMLTPSGQLITPKALSPKITEILEPIAHGARADESLKDAIDRVEAWMIRRALANNDRRKARTANKLGLTREGLYKKMKRLGIE